MHPTVTVGCQAYLTYAILGRTGIQGFYDTLDPLAIDSLMPKPLPEELRSQYLYHRLYSVNALYRRKDSNPAPLLRL